jgi:hypothetical protein
MIYASDDESRVRSCGVMMSKSEKGNGRATRASSDQGGQGVPRLSTR